MVIDQERGVSVHVYQAGQGPVAKTDGLLVHGLPYEGPLGKYVQASVVLGIVAKGVHLVFQ